MPGILSGFSVGGVDWLWPDLEDAVDQASKVERLVAIGFEDARLTHSMGGNILRVFFNLGQVLKPLSAKHIDQTGIGVEYEKPWYLVDDAKKLEVCDELHLFVTGLRLQLANIQPDGTGLNVWNLDAYLSGVTRYWKERGTDEPPVRVMLTHVVLPPVPIIEAPKDSILAAAGRVYRFRDLWNSYCEIHATVARKLCHRFVVAPGRDRIVCAIEIANEPDYEWLPDELRIEKSKRPGVNAVRKYITELHNAQIPVTDDPAPAYQPTPWQGFKDQDGQWTETARRKPRSVLEFDWGEKFDWYVECYAEYAEHFSYAISHEANSNGFSIGVIAAGVTHNNIDYLIRMHRANPNCFKFCTGIALHPYHWPGHDIYDTNFRRADEVGDWRNASPRAFAHDFFKCFDFFTEVAKLTRSQGDAAHGMTGKEIWLTEFGIPTKLLGKYNEHASDFVPFIRPRALPAQSLPRRSEVWEEIWAAFFDQVQPDFLEKHGVKALVFYTLRESAVPAFDKHDDDRSNFAILKRNGLPRMDEESISKFTSFMSKATGIARAPSDVNFTPMPAWARRKDYSSRLLKSAPWLSTAVPPEVSTCLTMLTQQERQLLYWLTSEYFSGRGSIVDAGCFAGGSSVALASGLVSARGRETWKERARIDSYDMFVADSFGQEVYFKPNGLKTDGDRFRNIYDAQTEPWKDILRVHDGDITTFPWDGSPIEILFIDVCKIWHVNDHVTRTFFPSLIPGRSLVIQQDFFHHQEYWLIATQELLSDYFEYVGYVPFNSAVFRCIEPVPLSQIQVNLRDLGLAKIDELMRRHIARYTPEYEVGMLTCALAFMHLDFGSVGEAKKIYKNFEPKDSTEHWLKEAFKDLGNRLQAQGAV